MIGIGALFVLTACGCMASRPMAKPDVRCDSVEGIDIGNMEMRLRSRGVVKLVDGAGYASDAGEGGLSKDWLVTVVQDNILRPSPSDVFRLVRVSASHISGSGEWDHVMIYACEGKRLKTVFDERYLYGAEVGIVNDAIFRIAYAERKAGDPMCCAASDRIVTYRWNRDQRAYLPIDNTMRTRPNYD
jgi:hypothetical protein